VSAPAGVTTAPAGPEPVWRRLGRAAGAKVIVMGVSGLLGIITSRLILSTYGIEAYAQYGLLASLPALLPFADLGIAAVVLNAVASSDDPKRDLHVRRTLMTAFRILLVTGPAIALGAVVVTALGLWPVLLGNGLVPGSEPVVLVCACLFGLALPLTVGGRVLVATGRTGTQILVQGLVAPTILLAVVVLVLTGVPAGRWLAVLSYVAAALVSVICLVIGARVLRPQVWAAARDVPRLRKVRGVPVIAVAGPMLVQMVVLPLATQTDRLLLSHLTRGSELAEYNLGSQLFGIALQTVSAAGVALWPFFARARATGAVRSPAGLVLAFGAGGLLLSGLVAVVSPVLVEFVSDGQLELDLFLVVAFVAAVSVQAVKYPLGMYMTDERGLRFQVLPVLTLLPVQVGLSWNLIGVVGPAGPVVANAVAGFFCQVLPYWWYVRRDLRRRRLEAGVSAR
jgi:O-antigen/teichoic acid export membrane protein